ncbi:hypothetical protein GCM10023335_75210 [Streptomyces siamensis]|uniref:Uncharacterized protein n=1 Tax=Streptomyces siamensis TaxID=1274986 RepID=A0ABP9JL83_9ACTN
MSIDTEAGRRLLFTVGVGVLRAVLATVRQTVFGLLFARGAVVVRAGVGGGFDRAGPEVRVG